ncbi:hypothetical protein IMSAGC008_02126 [Muribaculaceae bacterium]|nr:hypothetical protein IMSAGC008_02126 [Muribaculaceae bacterium]
MVFKCAHTDATSVFIALYGIVIFAIDNDVVANGVTTESGRQSGLRHIIFATEFINTVKTTVYLAVTVEVGKLDVTGAKFEVATLKRILISNAGYRHPVALFIFAIKVFFFKVAVCFKAPDFTVGLTCVEVVDKACVIAVFCNSGLAVIDIEVGINVGITEAMVPADTDFPATCAERTVVAGGSRCAKHRRKCCTGSEHILGVTLEPVECKVERVIEEAKVGTHVSGNYTFPCKSARHKTRHTSVLDAVAGVEPAQSASPDSRKESVGTDSLIADMAVGSTDLTVAEHIVYTQAFEVTFFCEAVTCRERGEECPLVGCREAA